METYFPQMSLGDEIESCRTTNGCAGVNVGDAERIASVAAGSGLVLGGLRHWDSVSGLALMVLGGGLVYRGVTGHCNLYGLLGMNTAVNHNSAIGVPAGRGERIEKSIIIDASPAKLYEFWADLENLPQFMDRLESVEHTGLNRSHWVAKAPLGTSLEWDAEVINEKLEELIAWRSLPGSEVDTAGSVHFIPLPGERGTEVRVSMKYDLPGGKASIALAKLIGDDPEKLLYEDLYRLKQLIESGETPEAAREREASESKLEDELDEASAESFPASDPPAVTSPSVTGGEPR